MKHMPLTFALTSLYRVYYKTCYGEFDAASPPSSCNAVSNAEDAVAPDSSPSIDNACQMCVSFFAQSVSTQEDDPLNGFIFDSSTCEN